MVNFDKIRWKFFKFYGTTDKSQNFVYPVVFYVVKPIFTIKKQGSQALLRSDLKVKRKKYLVSGYYQLLVQDRKCHFLIYV